MFDRPLRRMRKNGLLLTSRLVRTSKPPRLEISNFRGSTETRAKHQLTKENSDDNHRRADNSH